MYFLLLIAQNLWFFYGVFKNDLQVLLTNACAGFITILIIIFALYFRYRYNKQDNEKENINTLEMISIE